MIRDVLAIETIEKICEAFGMTLSQFFAEGNLIPAP